MSRHAISEPDPYPSEVNPDRADAEYREKRHAEVVGQLRHLAAWEVFEDLSAACWRVEHPAAGVALSDDAEVLAAFGREFGWPMTLRAVAQALETR